MEFGPVFRALMHNKARFWLITVEVALTLAIVANCVNLMLDERAKLLRPSGLDEANLVELRAEPFSMDLADRVVRRAQQELDVERLRALPGVRAATAISYIPLTGGGSMTTRRADGSKLDEMPCPFFRVGGEPLETLGVELVAGRDFAATDWPSAADSDQEEGVRTVILTQHLADQLFPDGNALGGTLVESDGSPRERVVGIIRTMHNAWPRSPFADDVMLVAGWPDSERDMRFLVRVEEGAMEEVFPRLEPTLREAHPGRIISQRSMTEIKARYYDDVVVLINVLAALVVILVAVTSLGIVGLTSFSVTQRTREIGTRRALGATRPAILRYFLVENWIITGIGLLLGALLTVGLNLALTHLSGAPRMNWELLVGGALCLWMAGQIAAAVPALRATLVPPDLATRSV